MYIFYSCSMYRASDAILWLLSRFRVDYSDLRGVRDGHVFVMSWDPAGLAT